MDDSYYKERRLSRRYFLLIFLGLTCFFITLLLAFFASELELFSFISFVPAIIALIAGIVLEGLAFKEIAQEEKRLFKFIEEKSNFTHSFAVPLTSLRIVEKLKNMGFAITEYPMENYHCVKQFDKGYECHFFLLNDETPDCPEAETFSRLFITTTMEILAQQQDFKKDFKKFYMHLIIGEIDLENSTSDLQNTLRKGAIRNGVQGVLLGFTAGYDTNKNVLYCADAMTRVNWYRFSIIPKHMTSILVELFGL